jgi:hypothetical protein
VSEQARGVSTKRAGEDLLVACCGLVTCVITALILWWLEQRFGFSFYSWTFWFVIPAGALLSGFAGAIGYYAGSLFFGHRPTRLLLLNIVIASVATFFLIHYLSYATLQIDGKKVRDSISFWRYLDIAIRSTSMEVRIREAKLGTTSELGGFGYAVAGLQVLGFALGGLGVYGYLMAQPYCDKCSRYLSGKGKQIRYTGDGDGLRSSAAGVLEDLRKGAIASAIERQRAFGTSTHQKGNNLRSVFEARYCKKCGQHWFKFDVETNAGDNWKEIPEFTFSGFTEQAVTV